MKKASIAAKSLNALRSDIQNSETLIGSLAEMIARGGLSSESREESSRHIQRLEARIVECRAEIADRATERATNARQSGHVRQSGPLFG